jgi:hypothetical protein
MLHGMVSLVEWQDLGKPDGVTTRYSLSKENEMIKS